MPRKTRSDAEILVLLALLAAIGPLSIDTYLPGMPAIAADLQLSSSEVERSFSAYFVGLAAGPLVCGPLSDRLGRRPILFGGLVVYLPATVVCVVAPTAQTLNIGRAVQALGVMAVGATVAWLGLWWRLRRATQRPIWDDDRAIRKADAKEIQTPAMALHVPRPSR